MRKKKFAALLVLAAVLVGCGSTGEKTDIDGNAGLGTEAKEGICYGQTVLEDEEAFYCCGMEQIRRIEKAEGETSILWEKKAEGKQSSFSMEGNGILLGDNLYFIEQGREESDGSSGRGLSMIKTDGSGYHRVVEPEDYPDSFYYYDGALYLEENGYVRGCPVTPEGDILEGEGMQQVSLENVPQDCCSLNLWQGVNRYMGAFESLNTFGFYLMEDQNLETVAVDPETGTKKILPAKGRLQAVTPEYLLFSDYGEDGEELWLLDTEAFDGRLLTVFEKESYRSGIKVLKMDEDHVYIVAEDPTGNPQETGIYEAVSLETGERRELFRLERQLGMEGSYPFYARHMTFLNGYVYYEDSQDYKTFLMRRSLEDTQTPEIIGDAFYDTGISQVGREDRYFERIYSEAMPDFVLSEIDMVRLVVDEGFEGAREINRVLAEAQEAAISYKKDPEDLKWREEELAGWPEEDILPYSLSYSYSSYPSEIFYFDGDRFSFLQMDYDYTGGAHGMPYWEGYTFDLHTGQRLLLSDLIEESEEELKEIVVRYFDEYLSKNPDIFWEEALKIVEESTRLSSRFYLTEEGITFYFEPYALASYAAGFHEVTIPYGEFRMKIIPIHETELK